VEKNLNNSRLLELNIRGLGVIESALVEFEKGLTVITGETGAGKTMILTALGLVLGSKSDSDFVRSGNERLHVSAKFSVSETLKHQIEEIGGVVDDEVLVISRSVTSSGKSRLLVGGNTVNLSSLNVISGNLVEVHAQTSSLRLSKSLLQRDLLDSYAKNQSDLSRYRDCFERYQELQDRIRRFEEDSRNKDAQLTELEDFLEVTRKIKPLHGEIDQIDQELERLGAVEELRHAASSALDLLSSEEHDVVGKLNAVDRLLGKGATKDPELETISTRLANIRLDLQDVLSELTRYLVDLQADPDRYEYLQQRKSDLNSLIKRFGRGSDRGTAFSLIIEDISTASARIEDLKGGERRIRELKNEEEQLFEELRTHAKVLSLSRRRAADDLAHAVKAEFEALAMPNASIYISTTTRDEDKPSSYTQTGIDEVSFLFKSYQEGEYLLLAKSASGGELSRIMLALEVVLAEASPIGTYIFDEVDAGVGGKAALEVGRRLTKLAQHAQVIVVTHLAQVASWADNHLQISKNETGSISESTISQVSDVDREIEIARLLSGQEESDAAKKHAKELLALVAKEKSQILQNPNDSLRV
jgi:DNA repair protein RecN (Recombination protein N)